jgi:hypothetical protein
VKKIAVIAVFVLLSVICRLSSVWAVDPQTLTITNLRNEAEGYVSTVEYARGMPLLLTNCVMYSSTAATTPQDLTGVQIVVKVGIPATNVTYYGTAQVATNGTWYCLITVPTNWDNPSLQISLTNTYTYPLKTIKTFQGL